MSMAKYYGFLTWVLAIHLSFGAPNGSGKSQNGSEQAFLEREPYKVNGHDVRLAIESSDYDKGTGSEAWLCINIDLPTEAPAIAYSKMKVDVADSQGEHIVAKATQEKLTRSEDHQCATFNMRLKIGQKIETVRVRWGNADEMFRYSKGQISDIYVF
jgi:hypothetical protein